MVEHSYYGRYTCEKETPIAAARFHAMMVHFAAKADIPGLREVAKGNFSKSASNLWRQPPFAAVVTEMLNPGNPENHGRMGLTVCLREVLKEHARDIMPRGAPYYELKAAVQEVPQLSISLAEAALGEWE